MPVFCSILPLFLAPPPAAPTFYRDVLPIFQDRCETCHRPEAIGPMPLRNYSEAHPWAKAIREALIARKMPPWFADPHYGKFENDPSLSREQIRTIAAWVDAGAPEGSVLDRPPARNWDANWSVQPDAIIQMPHSFPVPAQGEVEYQYIIVPTGFAEDRWIQKVEIIPGNRAAVHHAVIYIREPDSDWLRDKPRGAAFTVSDRLAVTKSDILFTYTPGNSRDEWPAGMAKLVKAGSELVFQMHYTATRECCADQTKVGLVFAKSDPVERVLTLQIGNNRFTIPPGHPDYRVTASGTLPKDAKLLSLYPHMHLRGKSFEYAVTKPGGTRETLLRVDHYDFYWQLTYRLAEPLFLSAGTRIECAAEFDNSRNNPKNPDPDAAVRFGYQSSDEMMIGFFDVAVPVSVDKQSFFHRASR